MRSLIAIVLLLLAAVNVAEAQEQNGGRKQARAVRVPNGSVELDGELTDAAWSQAPPITSFYQKEPVEGALASDPMDVRVVYDDSAIYIGARMHSRDSQAIQAPMSRRDDVQAAEQLLISFDTYLDRRTAYTFGVTASGVRIDRYHPTDDEDSNSDNTYDPVWRTRTRIDDEGWTAEFWLPFSQLRFNAGDEFVWGMNIKRTVPNLNEDVYWVVVPRTERGWASRFGELRGIEGVAPPHRMEIQPYVAGSSRLTGNRDRGNPFDNGSNVEARVGSDFKLALGPNLTLDATVNPDFGQVEADPAEVNLSTFETVLSERRSFFLEGNQLLTGPIQNLYYSRRIGARPTVSASGDYVDYPDTSTILGAAKVTGRLVSGTSIGVLVAETAKESADIFNRTTSTFSETTVAPRTLFAVSRVQQEFGGEDSTVGMQFTAMDRALGSNVSLSNLLVHRAFTWTGDTKWRFGNGAYAMNALLATSYLQGTPPALERVQRSSIHYFQRPDRDDGPRLDPTRTSLSGSKIQAGIDKLTGRHWLWGASMMLDTPELNTNDVGRLNDAGDIRHNANVEYRETAPRGAFRAYSINTTWSRLGWADGDLGGQISVGQSSDVTWSNYWKNELNWNFTSRNQDPAMTRGGPAMQAPQRWSVDGSVSSPSSSQTRWSAEATYNHNEFGDVTREVGASLTVRPRPSLQFSIDPTYRREGYSRQYVAQMDGGRAETYGRRYIFGTIQRSTLSTQIRLNYTFKPDLNLDFYAEPFAASGRYDSFGELLAARSRFLRVYGTDGTTITRQPNGSSLVTDSGASFTINNPDFNVRSFRSNFVLRWEWRPGSIFYFVWQQNRARNTTLRESSGIGDLFGSLRAPGDNILALKATFWLSTK